MGVAARALAAAALAVVGGCASIGQWADQRTADAVDLLRVHVIAGTEAFAAQVDATRFLSVGYTHEEDAWAWGLHTRRVGSWNESIRAWGLLLGRHDETAMRRLPRVSGSYGWNFSGEPVYQWADRRNPLDWLTFRATVALFVGLDLELRVGEVLDLVAGVFTWDPAHDDR